VSYDTLTKPIEWNDEYVSVWQEQGHTFLEH